MLIVSSTSCDQGSKVCRLLPSWCSRRGGCAVAHTTHLRDAQDRLLSMWDGPQRSAQATAPAMAARAQPRVDHLEVASGSALVAHLASGLRTRADAPSLTPAGGAACPDLVHVSAPAAPQGVKFGAVDVLTVPQLATVMGALQHQAAGTVQCVFLNVLHAGDAGFAGADAADAADTGEDGFAGGRDGANVLSRMSGVRFWITHNGQVSAMDAEAMATAFFTALQATNHDYRGAFDTALSATRVVGYTMHDGKLAAVPVPSSAAMQLAERAVAFFAAPHTAGGDCAASGVEVRALMDADNAANQGDVPACTAAGKGVVNAVGTGSCAGATAVAELGELATGSNAKLLDPHPSTLEVASPPYNHGGAAGAAQNGSATRVSKGVGGKPAACAGQVVAEAMALARSHDERVTRVERSAGAVAAATRTTEGVGAPTGDAHVDASVAAQLPVPAARVPVEAHRKRRRRRRRLAEAEAAEAAAKAAADAVAEATALAVTAEAVAEAAAGVDTASNGKCGAACGAAAAGVQARAAAVVAATGDNALTSPGLGGVGNADAKDAAAVRSSVGVGGGALSSSVSLVAGLRMALSLLLLAAGVFAMAWGDAGGAKGTGAGSLARPHARVVNDRGVEGGVLTRVTAVHAQGGAFGLSSGSISIGASPFGKAPGGTAGVDQAALAATETSLLATVSAPLRATDLAHRAGGLLSPSTGDPSAATAAASMGRIQGLQARVGAHLQGLEAQGTVAGSQELRPRALADGPSRTQPLLSQQRSSVQLRRAASAAVGVGHLDARVEADNVVPARHSAQFGGRQGVLGAHTSVRTGPLVELLATSGVERRMDTVVSRRDAAGHAQPRLATYRGDGGAERAGLAAAGASPDAAQSNADAYATAAAVDTAADAAAGPQPSLAGLVSVLALMLLVVREAVAWLRQR